MESFRDRIGFDSGAATIEDTLMWAAGHGFHYVDFNADRPPNILTNWTDERIARRRVGVEDPKAHRQSVRPANRRRTRPSCCQQAPVLEET